MEIINAGSKNIPFLNDNLKNRKSVVFFVAPWCGHCKRLEPTIDNIMGRFKNSNYPGLIARVEEKEIPKVKCDNDIDGFPTIRVMKPGGKKDYDYQGPRDEEALNDLLIKIFEDNNNMGLKRLPFNTSKQQELLLHERLEKERQDKMRLYNELLNKKANKKKPNKKKSNKKKSNKKKSNKKKSNKKKQNGGRKQRKREK